MNYKELSSLPQDNFNVEDVSNSAEFSNEKKYKSIFMADIPMFDLTTEIPALTFINRVVILTDKFQINNIVNFYKAKANTLSDTEQKIKIMIFCEALKDTTANDIDIIFTKDDAWAASTSLLKDMKYSLSTSLGYFGLNFIGTKSSNFRWFLENNTGNIIEKFNGYVADVATNQSKVKVEDIFWDNTKYKKYCSKSVADLAADEIFFNMDILQKYGFKDLFLNEVEGLESIWTAIDGVTTDKISQIHNAVISPVNFFRVTNAVLKLYGIDSEDVCGLTLAQREGNYILNKSDVSDDLTTEMDYIIIPRDDFSEEFIIYHEDAVMKTAVEYSNYVKLNENSEKYASEVYLSQCNYPEWTFLEKNILNVTNRPDISERLAKTIINGCIYKNDQTESSVGSNFSFEIYRYLIEFFNGNSNNSDNLAKALEFKLNNKISKMIKKGIFDETATRVVTVTEKAGAYEAAVKVVDPDKNRDYEFTIVLA